VSGKNIDNLQENTICRT